VFRADEFSTNPGSIAVSMLMACLLVVGGCSVGASSGDDFALSACRGDGAESSIESLWDENGLDFTYWEPLENLRKFRETWAASSANAAAAAQESSSYDKLAEVAAYLYGATDQIVESREQLIGEDQFYSDFSAEKYNSMLSVFRSECRAVILRSDG
jgi:hypothetical protein